MSLFRTRGLRRRGALVSVAALLALWSTGPLAAQTTPLHLPFTIDTLPNGLTLIVHQDRSVPTVAVNMWYHVGSGDERVGRTGFAHLFEHLMFMGSQNAEYPVFDRLLEAAGANNNGSTTEDRTNYYESGPRTALPLMLWLEADRMGWLLPTMDSAKVDLQRDVVKNERRQSYENRPYGMAFTELPGAMYPAGHPYSWPVIGSMRDLTAASVEDVKNFFRMYYAPNNATLVVVGDCTPAHLKALEGQYFAGVPRQPDPPPVTCDYKISPGARHRDVTDPHANLPAALRFYRIPPHADRDTPALDLLNVILGQGESSRLNVAVVRNAKAAVAVQAFANPFGPRRGPGVLVIFGIVNQGVAVEHLDSLIGMQIDSIRSSGVTPEELTKAKNTFRAGFIQDRETTLSKAEDLHHYDMFHDSLAEINTDLDRYLSVTADDIRRVANKYLDPANALTVIVRPAATPSGGAQ